MPDQLNDHWTLHWFEAEAEIGAWKPRIEAEIRAAATAIAKQVELPRLDVIITRIPGFEGIPEIGMEGHAYRRGCFSLTVSPDNTNFEAAVEAGHIRTTVTHEVNHCMRMALVGYGLSLGQALVSEGLAGQFTRRILNSQPEPWDVALGRDMIPQFLPTTEELASTEYDHSAWFFGHAPSRYPRWLGYSLGYAIVDEWLAAGDRSAMDLIATAPENILAVAMPRLRAGAIEDGCSSLPTCKDE